MLFKWYPWDVLPNTKELAQDEEKTVAFMFFDPFIEKLVLDNFLEYGPHYNLVFANEIDKDWIESNLLTLDLFANCEGYLIKGAENLSAEVCTFFKDLESGQVNKKIVFSFSKNSKKFQEICKSPEIEGVQVLEPRFWEGQKYFEFLSKTKNVVVSYEVQNFILKSLEATSANLVQTLDMIHLHFRNDARQCSVEDLKELLKVSKLDHFEMATLFNSKKFKFFYNRILEFQDDFDSLRSFFNFMQSHLIRMMDPSYIQKKPRANKYDKEVEMASRGWNKQELNNFIKLFGKLEIEAKKRSPGLRGYLRQLYLKQF